MQTNNFSRQMPTGGYSQHLHGHDLVTNLRHVRSYLRDCYQMSEACRKLGSRTHQSTQITETLDSIRLDARYRDYGETATDDGRQI